MGNFQVKIIPGLVFTSFCAISVCGRVGYEAEVKEQNEEVCISGIDKQEYRCAVGHCCGEANCCTHYYELWWFWVIWATILLLSCCCVYRHRKRHNLNSRRDGNGNASTYTAVCSYPGPPVDKGPIGFSKLPHYDDIIKIPPSGSPPPPYASSRTLNGLASVETNSEGVTTLNFLSYSDLTSSIVSVVNSLGFNFRQMRAAEQQADVGGSPDSVVTSSVDSLASRSSDSRGSRFSLVKWSKGTKEYKCVEGATTDPKFDDVQHIHDAPIACETNMSLSKCSPLGHRYIDNSFEDTVARNGMFEGPSSLGSVDVNNNGPMDQKSTYRDVDSQETFKSAAVLGDTDHDAMGISG